MNKQEIISTLEENISDLEFVKWYGHRLNDSAEVCGKILVELYFDAPYYMSSGYLYTERRLEDIQVSSIPNDPNETIVYADDLSDTTIHNILSVLGLLEYAEDLNVKI